MGQMTNKVLIVDLGTIAYQEAWELQHRIHEAKQAGMPADVLLLLEHPHVFTLGKNAKKENILVPDTVLREQGIECVSIERGGDVTYHGPGQLVGYPIFFLEALKLRVVDFVGRLEEVMIRVLNSYGLPAHRRPVNRGVWVKESKLGFVGIALRRGITLHGFALNVAPKLSYYNMIYSCGLKGVEIVSLSSLLRRGVAMEEVKKKTIDSFEDVFGLKTEPISLTDLRSTLSSFSAS
ncbi:MAG: octanoate-[acyl-carrier-protein]-protein-N-octan oyltransferase [Deltaproteobacteria bacterium]|nr:octanoate-[acyl-carrier-protein]-protein-N-octan oyltransferase [Deltaproteobacteria bacterium]